MPMHDHDDSIVLLHDERAEAASNARPDESQAWTGGPDVRPPPAAQPSGPDPPPAATPMASSASMRRIIPLLVPGAALLIIVCTLLVWMFALPVD
jgi:hypothetical protein